MDEAAGAAGDGEAACVWNFDPLTVECREEGHGVERDHGMDDGASLGSVDSERV